MKTYKDDDLVDLLVDLRMDYGHPEEVRPEVRRVVAVAAQGMSLSLGEKLKLDLGSWGLMTVSFAAVADDGHNVVNCSLLL